MEPFIGEIRIFASSYVPEGWLPCMGQTLSVQQYSALYSVLGVRYGGNGSTTFMLPDLRDKVPIHQGQGPFTSTRTIGSTGGASGVALSSASQLPLHTHNVMCQGTPAAADMKVDPTNAVWTNANTKLYVSPVVINKTPMNSAAVGIAGSTTPTAHNNLQPYLVMYLAIATTGIYPQKQD